MSLSDMWMYKLYKEYVEDAGDSRTKGWFLTDSPMPSLWITIGYFLFVTQIGPNYMKDRKAFNLKRIILAYNALQVALCLGVIYVLGVRLVANESLVCMQVLTDDTYRNELFPMIGWIYFMMKYLDMFDTVFFVLTKKMNYVSVLHLHHHMSMVFAAWFGVKYFPSGVLAVAVYLNTWVHAIMYSYYFCTLYFGKIDLKWKKLMTSVQLLQFMVGNLIFILHVVNPWCNFPKLILVPVIMHGFTFIYMFGQFYYKNYICIDEAKKIK